MEDAAYDFMKSFAVMKGVGCTLTIWSGWKCFGHLTLAELRMMLNTETKNERIQLLINGNLINAKKRRLGFRGLGVRGLGV